MNLFWNENQTRHLKKRAIRVYKKYRPTVVFVIGGKEKRNVQKFCIEVLKEKHDVQGKKIKSELDIALAFLGILNPIETKTDFIKAILRSLNLLYTKRSYPDIFVFIVDPEKRGEMKRICNDLKIDVLIVTDLDLPKELINHFKKPETYLLEQKKIFPFLFKKATLIAPEEIILQEKLSIKKEIEIISLFGEESSLSLNNVQIKIDDFFIDGASQNQGAYYQLHNDQNVMPLRLQNIISERQVKSSLFAVALALYFKINMVDLAQSFLKIRAFRGEMNPIPGIKNTLIIRDTNTKFAVDAIDSINEVEKIENEGNKICVISSIKDLDSKKTGRKQRLVAKKLQECFDEIILFGQEIFFIESELLRKEFPKEKIHILEDKREMVEMLKNTIIKPKDLIFLKLEGTIEKEVIKELRA